MSLSLQYLDELNPHLFAGLHVLFQQQDLDFANSPIEQQQETIQHLVAALRDALQQGHASPLVTMLRDTVLASNQRSFPLPFDAERILLNYCNLIRRGILTASRPFVLDNPVEGMELLQSLEEVLDEATNLISEQLYEIHANLLRQSNGALSFSNGLDASDTYRGMIDYSFQAVLILQNQQIVFANRMAWEFFGNGYEDARLLTTEDIYARIHPTDRDMVWQLFSTYLEGDSLPQRYEFRVSHEDGSEYWLEVFSSPSHYHGKPAVQVSYVDITERKKAEREVWISKERYDLAVGSARLGVWDWRPETNALYISPNLKALLGYRDDEIANDFDDWNRHIHPEDSERVMTALETYLKEDIPHFEIEHRMVHKNGSTRWVVKRGMAVRDENGKPVRVSGTYTDTTERKTTEQELYRRGKILNVVAFAAEQFLKAAGGMQVQIKAFLQQLGSAADVDRVYVFENQLTEEGAFVMSQRYGWTAEDDNVQATVDAFQKISYEEAGLARWQEILQQGEPVYGVREAFPEQEQGILEKQQVASLAIMPIFVGISWWGFIGFDDMRRQHVWSASEIDAIRAAAGIIGAAIHRAQVQQLLDKNEAEIRKLYRAVEQSPNTIIITDTNGTIEYVNPRFTEVTGYTFWEAVGQNPRILKSGETPVEEFRELWKTITAGQEWRGLFCNRKKNGELYWDSASVSPITNAHGVITHFVSVNEDITKRVKAEEDLRESEHKFRSVIEQSYDGIVLNDENGVIIEWNVGAEKICGLKRAETVGQPGWKILYQLLPEEQQTPEMLEYFKAYMQKFHATGDSTMMNQLMEFEFQHANGDRRFVQQVSFPIETTKGYMMSSIIRDITERKWAEEELRQARETAEAATRAKSEFLANMSHEIRTPLNAIIGMNNLLLATDLTVRQYDFVDTALTSSDGLLSIINDILDFSKIEAGRMELKPAPFDLRSCIEESLDLLATKAAEKSLDLAYLIDDDVPPTVVGDMVRLRQILINLLSSAVKFTDEGEVFVSVSLFEEAMAFKDVLRSEHEGEAGCSGLTGDDMCLHLRVRDTGIGISREAIDRLFLSFSQVDTSNVRSYGGTGLGLAISKHLAEMMGGKMWVESEQGVGSTFHVTLMMQPVVSHKVAPETDDDGDVSFLQPSPLLQGKRVLIVGDAPTSRMVLTRYVEFWGLIPEVVTTDYQALERLRQEASDFDVVILDIHKTRMEGLDLATEIRSFPQNDHLPLILIISLRLWYEASRSEELVFAASITRPVKPAPLYESLFSLFTDQPVRVKQPASRGGFDADLGRRHPLRILLAEDTFANQKMFQYSLESMGYGVDIVKNGLEVLDAVEHTLYDVVLMDVQMPEMDGIDATQHIRSKQLEENQPWIIALTAHAMEGDRERCLAAGMDDYVSKPVHVEELAEALLRVPPSKTLVPEELPVETPPKDQAEEDKATSGPERTITEIAEYVPSAGMLQQQTIVEQHPPAPPLDAERSHHFLSTIKKGGVELARDFINTFLTDMSERLTTIQTAQAEEALPKMQQAAHSLKSLSGQVGAVILSKMSEQLELKGIDNTLEGTQELVHRVTVEYQRVEAALLEEMRRIAEVEEEG